MNSKKEPGRFSIKFNSADPIHKTVIDLLNGQTPRRKAQFIANAILHYIHCPETPDIMKSMPADNAVLENMVMTILKKQNFIAPDKTTPKSYNLNTSPVPLPLFSGFPDNPDESEAMPDAASLAVISDTLAAFRRQ